MRFQLGHCEFVLLDKDDPALLRFRRYFQEQRVDALTELPNAASLIDELRKIRLRGGVPSLALIEVDDLHRINARYGRHEGDLVLRDVAEKLRNRIGADLIFRYEGGRFAVVMQRTGREAETQIQQLVDGVRRGIAATSDTSGGAITLSAGGSWYEPTTQTRTKELLATAERALTRALRLGGGRVWFEEITSELGNSGPHDLTSLEVQVPQNYFRLSLPSFRQILKPGMLLIAIEIADRQLLAVTNERLFVRLERVLDGAVRELVLRGEYKIIVGEAMTGHPILVAVSEASANAASRVAAEIERMFSKACAEESIEGRILIGRPVQVVSRSESIGLALRALQEQQRDRRVTLPLPIGHALRLVDDARSSEQRFFTLIRLHQTIARWLFAVFAAEATRLGSDMKVTSERLDSILKQPVSERTWVMLAAAYAKALAKVDGARLVLPSYVDAVSANDREVFRELEQFATVRNRFAHGHDVQAKTFADEWWPRIRALLSGPLNVLGDHPVRYVDRIDHLDEDIFDVHLKVLMGDNLAAESIRERHQRPIPIGRIVVMAEGQNLSISPFALYLRCPTCHTEEVFCLDQLNRGPLFKSLREGAHTVGKLSDAGVDPRITQMILQGIDRALVVL